jgi:uncharacterized membrane protein
VEKESIIVQSQKQSLKKFNIGVLLVGLLAVIISQIVIYSINNGYLQKQSFDQLAFLFLLWCRYILLPIGILLLVVNVFFILSKFSITVTNKRVYGNTTFGKRVDLPFDSISAVATSLLKGVAVSTSSGRISFLLIANAKQIHSEISKRLISRQDKSPAYTSTTQVINPSNADELKKYKELLDTGIINQEEFDAKKKQLLGI